MLNLLSVSELSTKLQSREISAREVLDAHLVQIERVNARVNTIVTLDAEGAYRQAKAIWEDPGQFLQPLNRDFKGVRVAYSPTLSGLPVERAVRAGIPPCHPPGIAGATCCNS